VSDRCDTNDPVEQAGRPSGSPGPSPGEGLGSVLREVLGQGPLRRGVALGRLVRGWEEVVGPELASETGPRGLDDGVLVVAASTPGWAVQVRFLAPEVCRRANRALGSGVVRSVRVVVRPEASKTLRHNRSRGVRTGPERPPAGPSSDRI
jgi:predicted nucleic acid-binding Zn ribbon protein